jgi:hypothetical protein
VGDADVRLGVLVGPAQQAQPRALRRWCGLLELLLLELLLLEVLLLQLLLLELLDLLDLLLLEL